MYLKDEDVSLLREEEAYVKRRYDAVARTLFDSEVLRIPRGRAARMMGLGRRQMQRIVKRFKQEGIAGLRLRSTRLRSSPNRTPLHIERMVVEVRKATGFGSEQIARIVNKGLSIEGRNDDGYRITDTTCYNILVRYGLVEAERMAQKEYKSFEWGHPDELVQADLTSFNGHPILTMEDDYSRK